MTKTKKCRRCNEVFSFNPHSRTEWRGRKYCTSACANVANAHANSISKIGKKNPMFGKRPANFKGGSICRKSGSRNKIYKLIYVNGQQVAEHRVLMEKYLGRRLSSGEVVHHKNGDSLDNRLSNLQVMEHGEHTRYHLREKRDSRERLKNVKNYA